MSGDIFYTYLHYRLDSGKPFYVGKGKGSRITDLESRNKHWHSIVNLVGYRVETVKLFLIESEAFQHERELISFYGRSDLGLGPLCNLTDGGEGPSGRVQDEGERKRRSEAQKRVKKIECPFCLGFFSPQNISRYHFDNCKLHPEFSDSTLDKLKVLCPHCKKLVAKTNSSIHHFDNCKQNINRQIKTIICPHCKKEGLTTSKFKSIHFNNCVQNKNLTIEELSLVIESQKHPSKDPNTTRSRRLETWNKTKSQEGYIDPRKGVSKKLVYTICDYCEYESTQNMITRFHNENCKHKPIPIEFF